MPVHEPFVADTPLTYGPRPVEGTLVAIDGESFYCVANYDDMPPFLMTLVSDSDHWMFLSSNGALTAGRRDPDHALFPYYTDDRTHDSIDVTGSKTVLFVSRNGKRHLWEPFSPRYEGLYRASRKLYKSIYGNKIVFEETNHDLALTFSYSWLPSARFGWVRRAVLSNHGEDPVSVALLDGIQNLMPCGIGRQFQLEFSTLADGYKESELEPESGVGLIKLTAIPTDRAEPNEALKATVVWSEGLNPATRLLSSIQIDRFRQGLPVTEETLVRGRRGAYFLNATVALPPGSTKTWYVVAEVDQDAADVAALLRFIGRHDGIRSAIDEDVEQGTRNLVRIVAAADGLQTTADELGTCRHFSNTLFNVMRGGIPDQGYVISRPDVEAFVARASREVFRRHARSLRELPETFPHHELLAWSRRQDDPDLERLAHEYLPLTFSRRHGDPSRPWNIFEIDIKDEEGRKKLNFQGNWRDIFQNWEALALSYPSYLESMIFKFLDASTADGYNPYRIMRDGFDWEIVDPHAAWTNIGYWSDHQVIYLLKLLEASAAHHPDALPSLLTRRVFAYANVPYRIRPYEALLEDPHNTIDFDATLDRTLRDDVSANGSDAALLRDRSGEIHHVNLTEKLLVLSLAKLFNYIPDAGIWMNTQRPEWNDANNALVGNGVSMVTLYYLRRFMSFCRGLFAQAGSTSIEVTSEIAGTLRLVSDALERHLPLLAGPISDRDRKAVLDDLGHAGTAHRSPLYAASFSGERTILSARDLTAFCDLVLQHIAHSIEANRREDGLYHAYNVVQFSESGTAIGRLDEMLEGQVAVLSSGALSPREAAALLDALRAGPLYRADQNSYILYPDHRLPLFLEKNIIPAAAVSQSSLLTELLRRGDRKIVVRDVEGRVHFNAAFCNGGALAEALEALQETDLGPLSKEETDQILDTYESVFDHRSFTGRSGTFYKYEGLGSIYWHMVSKLLLAVGEVLYGAVRAGEDGGVIRRLKAHYSEIRDGIGVHKSPDVYGAIPTDPYSHTPSFAGAQQPGMTGQVKEDIITRRGEMGATVIDGCLEFCAELVRQVEFLTQPRALTFTDLDDQVQRLELGVDSLAYTLCQMPVVAHRAGEKRVEVTFAGGLSQVVFGLHLDAATSAAVFGRTGQVERLDVFFDLDGIER
jgi:hypothetical protein